MTSSPEPRAPRVRAVLPSQPWEIAFVAMSCVLLHFMLGQPLGYPLTIAPAAVASLLCVYYTGQMTSGSLAAWIVLLLVPFINVLGEPSGNLIRFLRTDALWAFNVTVVWWAARGELSPPRSGIVQGAFVAIIIIAGYSAVQSGLAFLTGSNALYNPFRAHQYLHEYDAAMHDAGAGALSRAQGFYLEPSFGALVMVTLCVVLLLGSYRPTASMLIVSAALFFNRSFSGIITFVVIVAIHLSLSLGRQVGRHVKLGVAAAFIAVAALGLRQLLAARLGELTVEGASAYYRIISPLIVLRDVLQLHPFGVEMGQVEAFMVPYGLLQTGSEGNTLDNGLYVMVFYFGWLGLAAVLALLVTALTQVVAGNRRKAIMWTFIFFSMAFSGAIFVPEYALLVILVLYQFRAGAVHHRRADAPVSSTLVPT